MENIEDFVIEDGVLIDFKGSGGDVVIPEGVTAIGGEAFWDCCSLTSITIPEGVMEICKNAFAFCSSLTSIMIPEGVMEIGEDAFWYCCSLKSIIIPSSVIKIERRAFRDCDKLKEINLTGTELHVDFREIFYDSEFVALYAPEISLGSFQGTKAKNYAVMGFLYHLSEKENQGKEHQQEYIRYIKSRKDAREVLYDRMMEDEAVTVFAIKENLIPIGEMDSLIEKASENKKTEIIALLLEYKNNGFTKKEKDRQEKKQFEFETPTALLKKAWITRKKEDGTLEISGYKGEETSLVVPAAIGKFSVTSIGDYAFSPEGPRAKNRDVRREIQSVQIPSSVTAIGWGAFEGCSSLTSITMPPSVTVIGCSAFKGCSSLISLAIPSSVTIIRWSVFEGCSSLTSITIPPSVMEIDERAFEGCSSLTAIVIPKGISKIGANAFSDCSSLSDILVDEENKNYFSENGMLFNKNKTILYRAPSISGKIVIPEGVKEIRERAFSFCSRLTSITLSEGVKKIEKNTFVNCDSLKCITFPSSVTEISSYAFRSCKNLTSIIIPSSVTEIQNSAFWECDKKIIHAPVGSYAEAYAKKSRIPFVEE